MQLIGHERVDDVPVLLSQMNKIDLSGLINRCFNSHGNWQGISLGEVMVGWLAYILSQGDHRLNQVEQWAKETLETLRQGLNQKVRSLDFSDDRLASGLDYFSQDENWEQFEEELNGTTIRVYDLKPARIRIDSTTASSYREPQPGSLFQFGHSKDHRPDLPQVKINQAVLDPLGIPVSTTIVRGQQADDPLYIPEIKKVQKMVQSTGLTYVGDSKMSALEIRGYIARTQNHYLCPLPQVQMPKEQLAALLELVSSGAQQLVQVKAPGATEDDAANEDEFIAEGFSFTRSQSLCIQGEPFEWTEQCLVVHSFKQAQRQRHNLDQRLGKARTALEQLNVTGRGHKRRKQAEIETAVQNILQRYRVQDLLQVDYQITTHTANKRAYKQRPAQQITSTQVQVRFQLDQDRYNQTVQRLGWRVYATCDQQLTLQEAVYAYRGEYLVERGFGRLKGKSLGLTPMYLDDEQRVKGLIRLLSVGLRILCLVEFTVRSALEVDQDKLAGLYAGNPKRATARPTAELLLRAFRGITLTLFNIDGVVRRFLSPLSELQQRILRLLGLSDSIYSALTG